MVNDLLHYRNTLMPSDLPFQDLIRYHGLLIKQLQDEAEQARQQMEM